MMFGYINVWLCVWLHFCSYISCVAALLCGYIVVLLYVVTCTWCYICCGYTSVVICVVTIMVTRTVRLCLHCGYICVHILRTSYSEYKTHDTAELTTSISLTDYLPTFYVVGLP